MRTPGKHTSKPADQKVRAAKAQAYTVKVQVAKAAQAAWRDLKLPSVTSYALCDEPGEVAECKAFADAMFLRITGKRYRSHLDSKADTQGPGPAPKVHDVHGDGVVPTAGTAGSE